MNVQECNAEQQIEVAYGEIKPGVARERFLTLIEAMKSRRVEFVMHEKTRVNGTFEAMNIEGNSIAVRDLDTPIGRQEAAILRATDVISMSVDLTWTYNNKIIMQRNVTVFVLNLQTR